MNEATEALIGTVVTARRPSGRRFRLLVDSVEVIGDEALLIGRLPSVKFPGDFTGYGSAWASKIEP